jgi:hypothetical protein
VFIPTKGRYDPKFQGTIKMMDKLGVPYRTVVEPQERDLYAAAGVAEERLLVLPFRDRGLVATRNWIWDRALEEGHRYFWTFDDNIWKPYRLNHNQKVPFIDGTPMYVIEEFALRYENLPVCGMQYYMFAPRKDHRFPPIYLNARVYSNMLIETDFRDPRGRPYRNEGFYNDDTDLCLRILKDGNCTVLFNAFLIQKLTTMHVEGGMTSHYVKGTALPPAPEGWTWEGLEEAAVARGWYLDPTDAVREPDRIYDGRWRMAVELAAKHPDVTRIARKFSDAEGNPRFQHQVDYRPWRANRLRRRPGVAVPQGVNEYGMVLERLNHQTGVWSPVETPWYPWEDAG